MCAPPRGRHGRQPGRPARGRSPCWRAGFSLQSAGGCRHYFSAFHISAFWYGFFLISLLVVLETGRGATPSLFFGRPPACCREKVFLSVGQMMQMCFSVDFRYQRREEEDGMAFAMVTNKYVIHGTRFFRGNAGLQTLTRPPSKV